ncbi:hypothetical protein DM02DRAFT_678242 [Periconia macrospinosa]|uniref:BZIP domain-containing protein n=1 Tax=Periconia macrospinosa TaxID=97972 RepID=A0A2V1D0U5_9PLEO|nr:hypothetical protein DM02DRAFT_678242 [Periconia macrospinosa]
MTITSDDTDLFGTYENWVSFPGQFGQFSYPSASMHFASALYASQPAVVAINSDDAHISIAHTASPLQPRSNASSPGFATGGSMHSATYTTCDSWSESMDQDQHGHRRRRSSTSQSSPMHTVGRKRKSENIEPGSARAIYLEKNHKAASKCRSKQRRQQEELVETV